MRQLRRNTTIFEYFPPGGVETDLNEQGEHTGDFQPVYAEPVSYRGSISSPSGSVNQTFYGQDIRYTHTLVMDQPDVDIRENGKIRWKDNDYEIMAVRPSINFVSFALRRITSDAAEAEETEPEDPEGPEDPETPEEPEEPVDPENPEEPVYPEDGETGGDEP